MLITAVVAMTREGVMGKDNALPWHIPEDLKHFKKVTTGKPIVMGRKTFDSIGKPLPKRPNIVLSRNPELKIDGVETYTNLEDVLQKHANQDEICIIGGAEIFKRYWNNINTAHITWIESDFDGDTVFPVELLNDFSLLEEQRIKTPVAELSFSYYQKAL